MSDSIQAVRGMNDVLPRQTIYWQRVESVCQQVAAQYGYQEIRFPILEKTQLFKRCIGDATDIVEKEMYTFEDRNGDSLTLRPEGTAGCVRAGIQQGLLYNQIQRLWYLGPMFRHERPQKGRYRQFQQFGVEAFGLSEPGIDVEMILLSKRVMDVLGISDEIRLEINTLGTLEQRKTYRDALVAYLKPHGSALDADSQRRLSSNPLRVLDSKDPATRAIVDQAPRLMDFVDGEARAHFDAVCALLTAVGVSYTVNPYLVRGLDYYGLTVFEWITEALGAQGTVCAGGRYDGLVSQLGGKPTPAVGFAMGMERVVLLLSEKRHLEDVPDVCVVVGGDDAVNQYALQVIERCRDQMSTLRIAMNVGGSLKSQMKRADKSGARVAIIIGESEVKDAVMTVKSLREDSAQQLMTVDQFILLMMENRP